MFERRPSRAAPAGIWPRARKFAPVSTTSHRPSTTTTTATTRSTITTTTQPLRLMSRLVLLAAVVNLVAVLQVAGATECTSDGDCGNTEKICHENRCICARDWPIEDQDRCLSLSLLNEPCSLSEQCLGNSMCVDGICSCGNDAISLYNPSSRIYYCHPKRRLNEECNYDSQCPSNSYCSTSKYGCICQNGFGPMTVNNGSAESLECLPKTCANSSTCESEFHLCEEDKCKCVATHFDPTSAKCYKFGSTGGKPTNESSAEDATNLTSKTISDDENNNIYSILKDLTQNTSDRWWLVLIILIPLSLLLFILIFMLLRKNYIGYCWTAHKMEYEPNTKNPPRNGYFDKSSINNKSFRKKNGPEVEGCGHEEDEEDDDSAADRSNLMDSKNSTQNNNNSVDDSVRVNISHNDTSDHYNDNVMRHFQLQVGSPLKTSTSTPV